MSYFQDVPVLPDDPIFSLPLLFADDPSPNKVNLGIGVYQNEEGKPFVLNSVRKAEALVIEKHLGKNYLPIDGDADYIKETLNLIFGADSPLLKEKRIFGVQTVGGAGALRLGAEFLKTLVSKKIFISNPSWINHQNIFKRSGLEIDSYPYFNYATHTLDFPSLCRSIQSMPAGSLILLQGCGHNPTGVDPTLDQWRELSKLIKAQKILPFFDLAYQGFGKGLDEDAQGIRIFAEDGHEMAVAYSYSKNMGLYGERVGALALVSHTPDASLRVASQLRQMIRGVYSTPPLHGGRLAAAVLKSSELRQEWLLELKEMRERLNLRRKQLADSLRKGSDHEAFKNLDQQKGMFSYCGISPEQVQHLIKKHAIYLPADGRINVAGLNLKNMDYVSQAILETMHS